MLFQAVFVAAACATSALSAAVERDAFPSKVHLQLMNIAKKHTGLQVDAPASAHLTNYGGPVIKNVQVNPIFYGAANYQTQLNSFYKGVVQSSWYDILAQYNVNRGSAVNGLAVSAAKNSLDDANDIQPFLINLVKTGKIQPNANTYFPIHFAPGISITQGGSGSCQVFCAYHGTIDISSLNVGTQYLYYGVMPDQGGSCAGGCGSDPSTVNNLFSVSSHELAEAATDAAVGVAANVGPPLAWYDQTNGEIGDICNAQQGTTVGGDGVTYVIQTQWSNSANACVASGPKPSVTTAKPSSSVVPTTSAKPSSSVKTSTTSARASTTVAPKCNHSECTTGPLLNKGCSACAAAVCKQDSYCCTNQWDSQCVSEVNQYCTTVTC
ncbi:hypothetical protein BC830DRAFT_824765 [Chytriomyces sp. MP71]|nr:hypothetical protein BC830DRAFT_824765 [Chytriomyces sp. MP71]